MDIRSYASCMGAHTYRSLASALGMDKGFWVRRSALVRLYIAACATPGPGQDVPA